MEEIQYPKLKGFPRADTNNISRIDALGWLSIQAILGVPEAAKLEQEISRLQKLCAEYNAPHEKIYNWRNRNDN